MDISDAWKNSYSENTSQKVWAAKYTARHPNLVALELSSFKCGHDAPIYTVVEETVTKSGTPYFSFKDIDENKPTGSIRIRVETIGYFLKRYREDMIAQKAQGIRNRRQAGRIRGSASRGIGRPAGRRRERSPPRSKTRNYRPYKLAAELQHSEARAWLSQSNPTKLCSKSTGKTLPPGSTASSTSPNSMSINREDRNQRRHARRAHL